MIRLFKHYVPHAVLLLGLVDIALLMLAGELGWVVRARQIGIDPGHFSVRWAQLSSFALLIEMAMVAVGVYGPDALRSMRISSFSSTWFLYFFMVCGSLLAT